MCGTKGSVQQQNLLHWTKGEEEFLTFVKEEGIYLLPDDCPKEYKDSGGIEAWDAAILEEESGKSLPLPPLSPLMGKEEREGGNVCTEETLPELGAVERRVVLRFVMRRFNNCELGYFPSQKQNQLEGEIGLPFRESGDNRRESLKNMSGLVLWIRVTSGGKFPFTSRAMCRLAVGPWMNPPG